MTFHKTDFRARHRAVTSIQYEIDKNNKRLSNMESEDIPRAIEMLCNIEKGIGAKFETQREAAEERHETLANELEKSIDALAEYIKSNPVNLSAKVTFFANRTNYNYMISIGGFTTNWNDNPLQEYLEALFIVAHNQYPKLDLVFQPTDTYNIMIVNSTGINLDKTDTSQFGYILEEDCQQTLSALKQISKEFGVQIKWHANISVG